MLKKASLPAKIFLALAILALLWQAVSLVERVRDANTDFSIFHRAAVMLSNGAGGEIYSQTDTATGWYYCIPPIGLVLFMPLASITPSAAAAVWAVFNLALVAIALFCIHAIAKSIDLGETKTVWLAGIFALLASACIQTGQTSIFFATCWLSYIIQRKPLAASFVLALPAAIKLYPVLFGLIPLIRKKWSETGWAIVWLAVLMCLVPLVVFGHRWIELTSDFFQYQVFDPGGRAGLARDAVAVTTQSLEAVMARYLSFVPDFHAVFKWVPHLDLQARVPMLLAHGTRLLVTAATMFASFKIIRKYAGDDSRTSLWLMALWCAALYVMLPGAKARYAVYAFPAFIPLLQNASRTTQVALAMSLLLLLQAVPQQAMAIGVCLLGPIYLWSALIRRSLASS